MDRLPRDVVADVLALLPPRALAVSRCVCRDWRDAVDADARSQPRLRRDLLPFSVAGIFIMTNEAEPPEFFVKPSMARKIASDLQSYLWMDKDHHGHSLAGISDCCNGLILFETHVVNPATRQWVRLPPYSTSPAEEDRHCLEYLSWYLVFDPTVSPHFEVLAMKNPTDYKDEVSGESQWPPREYVLRVYSSSTQRWEERPFLLEEEGGGKATANVWSKFKGESSWHAVYCNGALYVYWTLTFITRITVSTNKYKVINLPTDVINPTIIYDNFRLGKSAGGVHFAVACRRQGLQIFILDESGSKTEWVLKHVTRYPFTHDQIQTDRPWILQHGGYAYDDDDDDDDKKENKKEPIAAENDSDSDFDADNAIDIDLERVAKYDCQYIDILGFHPYRDIVFLVLARKVVAYYFNSSKVQYLGRLLIRYRYQIIQESFIYTPTWIGELPEANYVVRSRNSYNREEEGPAA